MAAASDSFFGCLSMSPTSKDIQLITIDDKEKMQILTSEELEISISVLLLILKLN